MTVPAMAEETVLLHAAGSLRAALTEVAKAFEAAGLGKVQAKFGASGLLKDEIAAGAKAEVFASANMEHPQALAAEKRSGPVVLFARNRLCALARPGLEVDAGDRCWTACSTRRSSSAPRRRRPIRPAITPGRFFAKPRSSSRAPPRRWRRKRCSSPAAPRARRAPQGRSVYGELIAQGAADIFLTYCTNALAAQRENPAQQIVALPDALAVGADYGLTVMNGASAPAYKFAMFILSAEGQRTLAKHGFAAPALPQ